MPAIDVLAKEGIITPEQVQAIKEKYPDTNFYSSSGKYNKEAIDLRNEWIQRRFKCLRDSGGSSDNAIDTILEELKTRGENLTRSWVEKIIY